MNNDRRKKLNQLVSMLEGVMADLETLRDEEQDAFDNLPESLQQSEKGQASQQAIEEMDSARESIETANDSIENAKE